jgi:hypothetical protein
MESIRSLSQNAVLIADVVERHTRAIEGPVDFSAKRRQRDFGEVFDVDENIAAAFLERAAARALNQVAVLIADPLEDQGRVVRGSVGAKADRIDRRIISRIAKSDIRAGILERTSRESRHGGNSGKNGGSTE